MNIPEIGNVNEGIVEGCEDACDAEDIFTCAIVVSSVPFPRDQSLTFTDLRSKGDVLGGRSFGLLLWRHVGCSC